MAVSRPARSAISADVGQIGCQWLPTAGLHRCLIHEGRVQVAHLRPDGPGLRVPRGGLDDRAHVGLRRVAQGVEHPVRGSVRRDLVLGQPEAVEVPEQVVLDPDRSHRCAAGRCRHAWSLLGLCGLGGRVVSGRPGDGKESAIPSDSRNGGSPGGSIADVTDAASQVRPLLEAVADPGRAPAMAGLHEGHRTLPRAWPRPSDARRPGTGSGASIPVPAQPTCWMPHMIWSRSPSGTSPTWPSTWCAGTSASCPSPASWRCATSRWSARGGTRWTRGRR